LGVVHDVHGGVIGGERVLIGGLARGVHDLGEALPPLAAGVEAGKAEIEDGGVRLGPC
jgi:hypothetical protein